jgi:hypothetical protein
VLWGGVGGRGSSYPRVVRCCGKSCPCQSGCGQGGNESAAIHAIVPVNQTVCASCHKRRVLRRALPRQAIAVAIESTGGSELSARQLGPDWGHVAAVLVAVATLEAWRCLGTERRQAGRPRHRAACWRRQNGLVGRYLPSSVITAREPPSGSSVFSTLSLKLMALMMPSPNFS